MKIIQVIDQLNVGGGEKVFVDMCNILNKNNIEVSAMFLLEAGVLRTQLDSNIPYFEVKRIKKWSLKKIQYCSLILNKFDIIHCHFRHVYRYISLVNLLFPIKGKIIFHDHYGLIEKDTKVPFLFSTLFKPNYYIGVSKTLTYWAEKKLKVHKDRIFKLENIIIKTETIELSDKKFDFILVSNIKPIKNNIFAVKLAKKLNKSLLLVGQNQNDNYFNELSNLANESNVVVETNITNAQIILQTAHFGLHTSLSETGPLVLIEYIAHKLPFLAFETGEVSITLKKYFPDFFINSFEIDEWEERISLIQSKQYQDDLFDKVFEMEFGEKKYFSDLIEIYLCVNKKN
ncbi:glycosyltransferase [Flavobacterium sp.]|jgi:glycosyltransferase involved in cell wall biosynthesis|uniref:glycosyltransferase n=1 Tax=Flavobacterium sp. TaxID=239 RepID=UPI0037C19304